jgi:ubiquitin-protein ligase
MADIKTSPIAQLTDSVQQLSVFSKTADVGELPPITTKRLKKFMKRRYGKELKENTENTGFDFVAASTEFWYFRFTVEEGPYIGQVHIIEVKLIYGQSPDIYTYPCNAPKCTFMTSVWHPNVSEKGTICLDVLKDNWSPATFTASIMTQIKLLLNFPEPSSPQNRKAADMMANQPDEYKKKISEFYQDSHVSGEVIDLFTNL